ncbi:MAG: cell division protein SepF [Clostridiales bacterium]|nr:cell division protein SepF [Clostridiales bacterium]
MANILDKFLNSMKLYEDDDYEDDEFDMEEEEAPRRSFRKKSEPEMNEQPQHMKHTDYSEKERVAKTKRPNASNVVSMKSRVNSMEVCMIKPSTLDDAREVCDVLLSGRAVVINMEGVHVDLAQRIIDFTSGAVYSINGNLQKISKYIFIVSPQSIGLTGDFQDSIEGSQDLSALNLDI